MTLKLFLVLMTAIAVVCDSMLHPFYPQYFASVFGVTDARHVGAYIASCSLTVLLTFPLWALIAKRMSVLRLLIGTQLATCLLSLACYGTRSLLAFWIISLCMMVFKASYLLIYPYVMSLEAKENHVSTISLLAFVVYFGNILAALASGALFEFVDPRSLFLAMAAGDALQIALCFLMLRAAEAQPAPASSAGETSIPPRYLLKLGIVMFVLYFSAYVSEPFFAQFWEAVSALDNKFVAGCVYAGPGAAALVGLYVNSSTGDEEGTPYAGIASAIALGVAALAMQASGLPIVVVVGRFLYGWSLFQSMVRLDGLLFRYSTPETYAVDFSKANLFQGLGVLAASSCAGSLVEAFGVRLPFAMAALGFVIGGFLYLSFFRSELRASADSVAGVTVDEGSSAA
jgi:DHA1 family multidrug resistance protein-like MFS transporter